MTPLFSQPLLLQEDGLSVVHARFERSEGFTDALFEGFTALRVLTYSVSIPMTVRMLHRFRTVECVFGYEGVLHDFATVVACQKELSEHLLVAVKGLEDARKRFLLAKVAEGAARFYVVKGSVAHSKIYLLEGESKRRVVVGPANFSERAVPYSGVPNTTSSAPPSTGDPTE